MPIGTYLRLKSTPLLLVLFAVLFAGLVPNGYMPGRTGDGGFGFVLCPDGGPPLRATSAADAHAHHAGMADAGEPASEQPAGDMDGERCAWAALAASEAMQATGVDASQMDPVAVAPAISLRSPAPGLGLAAPPPPSRAPPRTA